MYKNASKFSQSFKERNGVSPTAVKLSRKKTKPKKMRKTPQKKQNNVTANIKNNITANKQSDNNNQVKIRDLVKELNIDETFVIEYAKKNGVEVLSLNEIIPTKIINELRNKIKNFR